ncbi:hypothetical protein V8E51_008845 [Hyaloscypha variabilis]
MRIFLVISALFAFNCEIANTTAALASSTPSITSMSQMPEDSTISPNASPSYSTISAKLITHSSVSTTQVLPTQSADATITLFPKVPEYLTFFNCSVVTTSCESTSNIWTFSWGFDAATSCFQCPELALVASAQSEIAPPTLTGTIPTPEPVSSFPSTYVGFPVVQTTIPPAIPDTNPSSVANLSAAASVNAILSAGISQRPLPYQWSLAAASYVEYLASFVSSVAANSAPTTSIDAVLLSKISILTVGLPSQQSTATKPS